MTALFRFLSSILLFYILLMSVNIFAAENSDLSMMVHDVSFNAELNEIVVTHSFGKWQKVEKARIKDVGFYAKEGLSRVEIRKYFTKEREIAEIEYSLIEVGEKISADFWLVGIFKSGILLAYRKERLMWIAYNTDYTKIEVPESSQKKIQTKKPVFKLIWRSPFMLVSQKSSVKHRSSSKKSKVTSKQRLPKLDSLPSRALPPPSVMPKHRSNYKSLK